MRILLRCGLLVAHVRVRDDPLPSTVPDGVVVRICQSVDDLLDVIAASEGTLDPEWCAAAFARGDYCYATFFEEDLVSYGWRGMGQVPHVGGVWVTFGEGLCYSYKAWTRPKYRGKKLRGSFGQTARFDKERGTTQGISFVETHNLSSLRSKANLLSKRVGWAGYFELGPIFFGFRSPGARRYGFRFVRRG